MTIVPDLVNDALRALGYKKIRNAREEVKTHKPDVNTNCNITRPWPFIQAGEGGETDAVERCKISGLEGKKRQEPIEKETHEVSKHSATPRDAARKLSSLTVWV